MISTRADADHGPLPRPRGPAEVDAGAGSTAERLARSLRREEELRGLLLLAHEQSERDEEELRELARRFQADLRREAELREALEGRLNRFRRSLPGRLFLTLRAISSIGRR